jgi:hypothetical protein
MNIKWKRTVLLFFALFLFWGNLASEESKTRSKISDFALGVKCNINFSKIPSDFQFMLTANSPYFFNFIALRADAGIGLLKGTLVSGHASNEIWDSYYIGRVGVAVSGYTAATTLRPYGEFGFTALITHSDYTDTPFLWGIYTLFGLDLLFREEDWNAFFVELGAAGIISGGGAEKWLGNPAYANGVMITVGNRFYF